MKKLTQAQFAQLTENAKILKCRHFKPKVLEKEGQILKCFYRKREFSKRLIFPPAKKFFRNSRRLQHFGFHGPEINLIAFVPSKGCHILRYPKMAGEDLRTLAIADHQIDLKPLATLIARLHQKGIYFRAIHLGNVLKMADKTLALIDITDVSFTPWALTKAKRQRNLDHLFNHELDQTIWARYGQARFLKEYENACYSPSIL